MAEEQKHQSDLTLELSGSLPEEVQKGLFDALSKASEEIHPDRLSTVRNTIRSGNLLSYDRDWAPFAYLYFGANFAKSYLATRQLAWSPNDPVTVLDLGCGGGASTLGALAALRRGHPTIEVAEVVGIDRSPEQLALFREVLSPWIRRHFPSTGISLIERDLLDVLRRQTPRFRDCLTVLSYVMPELSAAERRELPSLLQEKLDGSSSETVIIESNPNGRGVIVERLSGDRFVAPYDEVRLDLSLLEILGSGIKPKFATNDQGYALLRAYFAAWQKHDTVALRDAFDPDATYTILGSKTLEGIEEIVAYWNRNAETQRGVSWALDAWAHRGESIVASWTAEFQRIDRNEYRKLSGLLWIKMRDGRIAKFTEAYRQDIGPLRHGSRMVTEVAQRSPSN